MKQCLLISFIPGICQVKYEAKDVLSGRHLWMFPKSYFLFLNLIYCLILIRIMLTVELSLVYL